MATKVSRGFKDISLFFEPHPVTNDVQVLLNERSINRSIRNLIETLPTERFFNSDLGSELRSQLFEIIDIGTIVTIRSQIENIINRYEPRVTDVIVEVTPLYDENSFEVTVSYTIIGQNVPSQPYTFILQSVR